MNQHRISVFRIFRLLLPVFAVLVMQTAMLMTMAQARVSVPQAVTHSHDPAHQGHLTHEGHQAQPLPAESPCHETGDASTASHPPCLALCCLALPLLPVLMAMTPVITAPGLVLLPVLSGVQTIPPSPPPRG